MSDTATGSSARCKPRGSVTLATSSYARVNRAADRHDDGISYACVLKTGRRFRLDNPNHDIRLFALPASSGVTGGTQPKLAGTHLVYDLDGDVTAFFVNRRGAVAWSLDDKLTNEDVRVDEVRRFGAAGEQLQESSPAVDAESLAVSSSGKRFFWMSGETPRSAELR